MGNDQHLWTFNIIPSTFLAIAIIWMRISHIVNPILWVIGCIILSNSTPTCKPNSTSVGLSRSWLCFPTEEEEQEEGRNNPHLASSRRNAPTCGCGCPVGVRRVSNVVGTMSWWCLDSVRLPYFFYPWLSTKRTIVSTSSLHWESILQYKGTLH